jgi:hypothetical protein
MIKLCRENPLVVNGTGEEKTVLGPSALLLRVLLLAPEPEVPVEAASTSIEIKETGFGNYLELLRSEYLGNKRLIVRKNRSVRYTGDREQMDAAIIRSKYVEILEILGRLDGNGREIDRVDGDGDIADNPVVAEKILPLIEDIEGLYDGNPAIGLDRDWAEYPQHLQGWAQGLNEVTSYWIDLWTSVQLLAADCKMLLRPGKTTAGKLVTSLLKIARVPDPVEEVWPRLLRAAEMSQNYSDRKRVWKLTADFYVQIGEEVPETLRQYAPPSTAVSDSPTTLHRARPLMSPLEPSHDGLDNLREMAEVLGITSASTLRLRGEAVDPMQCIEQTKNLLYFSGVLASKWVMDPGVRNAFDELLTRLDALPEQERDVRFLIIDPDGDAYSLLYQMRGGRLSNEAVPHLRDLARRHPSFQVAVVDALPSFRIVVIDEDMVSFSPYALEEERYATSKLGWEAPHILLDPRAPYPLAEAFRLYFKERWDNARLL